MAIPNVRPVDRERATPGARDVPGLLGRVDLGLDLLAEARPVRVEHDRQDLASGRRRPLGTDDRDDPGAAPPPPRRPRAPSSIASAATSGTARGWSRWPGSAVSGRQTIRAPSRPASSTAATAAGTASSRVAVSGVDATAMRIVDMAASLAGPRQPRAAAAPGPASPPPRRARRDPSRRCGARRASRAGAARPRATRRRRRSGRRDPRPACSVARSTDTTMSPRCGRRPGGSGNAGSNDGERQDVGRARPCPCGSGSARPARRRRTG